MTQTVDQLSAALTKPVDQRCSALIELGKELLVAKNGVPSEGEQEVIAAILKSIEENIGTTAERVSLGELLGHLGDPRLRTPDQDDYWTIVEDLDDSLKVGRFPVSHAEFSEFVDSGEYYNDEWWSEAGLDWRDSGVRDWGYLAKKVSKSLVVPNQPVVGTTFYEAEAYANYVGARLPTVQERLTIVRGEEKRPYPWGEPFGKNHSNTREEVVKRPCAIGLFTSDCTPDGVWDLAGNAAEWLGDDVGGQRLFHPGSWKQTSMASWAKARQLEPASYRADDLGFRLIK